MSRPNRAFDTSNPISVNSGIVANAYSVTPSPTATFRKLNARMDLPDIAQIDRNDTKPSAIGI